VTEERQPLFFIPDQVPISELGRLLVLDTGAAHVDTLVVSHTQTDQQVWDMHFFHNGTALLYCIRPDGYHTDDFRFYSVSLEPGSRETLLFQFPGYVDGFDVFDGDSIYVDSLIRDDPAVNPVRTRWVAYSRSAYPAAYRVWMLQDRQTGVRHPMFVGSGTRPTDRDFVEYPAWTPDGNELVFTAGERHGDRVEIWVLKNAGDFLPIRE